MQPYRQASKVLNPSGYQPKPLLLENILGREVQPERLQVRTLVVPHLPVMAG